MKSIVVTGAHGMFGRDCVDVLAGAHVVVPLSHAQLDISDGQHGWECLSKIRPQAIVNCAAYTDVNACETHPAAARAANVFGPRFLAEASRKLGVCLIHVSSDYVFDGQKRPPAGIPRRRRRPPKASMGGANGRGRKQCDHRLPST